jgi:hypothetical protein
VGIAHIFSKPFGMKRFLLALDEIDLEVLTQFSSVRKFLKLHIKSEAFAAESRKAIVRLLKDGMEPKTTAYLFMRVLLEDLLLDGEYHALRGKLTPDGENFLAVYNSIVRELRVLKWYSLTQAEEHFQAIGNGIALTAPVSRQPKILARKASAYSERTHITDSLEAGRPVLSGSLLSARSRSERGISGLSTVRKVSDSAQYGWL